MNLHVDLGQLFIIVCMSVIGFFLKKEIATFGKRLDRHELVLFDMNGSLTKAIGAVEILFKLLEVDRRYNLRGKE